MHCEKPQYLSRESSNLTVVRTQHHKLQCSFLKQEIVESHIQICQFLQPEIALQLQRQTSWTPPVSFRVQSRVTSALFCNSRVITSHHPYFPHSKCTKKLYLVYNAALTTPIIWCTMMSTSSSFRLEKAGLSQDLTHLCNYYSNPHSLFPPSPRKNWLKDREGRIWKNLKFHLWLSTYIQWH